jgi:hypothetical protein
MRGVKIACRIERLIEMVGRCGKIGIDSAALANKERSKAVTSKE